MNNKQIKSKRLVASTLVGGLFAMAGAWIGWSEGSSTTAFILWLAIVGACVGACTGLVVGLLVVRSYKGSTCKA